MIRAILVAALAASAPGTIAAQSVETGREASQFVPIENEPPAELFVERPLAGPLARGAVIIPYLTAHFRILPIAGGRAHKAAKPAERPVGRRHRVV